MNPIPRLGNLGRSTVDVASLGAALLASMAVTAWATRQAEERFSALNSGPWVNLAGKAGVAALVYMASRYVVKNPTYRNVVLAGAFAPLLVDVLERFVPTVAAMVPVLSTPPAAPPPKPSGTALANSYRPTAMAANLRASLNAQLEDDQNYIYGY